MKNLIKKATALTASLSLATGCAGEGVSTIDPPEVTCHSGHATSEFNTKNLIRIIAGVERSIPTGKRVVIVPQDGETISFQSLVIDGSTVKVSPKNQVKVGIDKDLTTIDLSPMLNVQQNMALVIQAPLFLLEEVKIIQAVKSSNPQIGGITTYPIEDSFDGYEHQLKQLEGVLDPGSLIQGSASNFIVNQTASGEIIFPETLEGFIDLSQVENANLNLCS